MTSIYFVGPYSPITCGIADYTGQITRESPNGKSGVISFNPTGYGTPLNRGSWIENDMVWRGIPSREEFSASTILNGLDRLGAQIQDTVLWFQHENAIWPDDKRFVTMLNDLDLPKIVTFHTLHFNSSETPSGLRKNQYDFLKNILPHIDAITVFSNGVRDAVTSAFPQYCKKVHLLRHGVNTRSDISRLTRREAKGILNDFLLYDSDLDKNIKEELSKFNPILNPDSYVMGETGFLCPMKDSQLLYFARHLLARMVGHKKIVALRIGAPRDSIQRSYAEKLRREHNGIDSLLLETCLPENMLRVAQRAFDINFYWPKECTQSGILASALGTGALIAGRDLEGSGEILRQAGGIAENNLFTAINSIRDMILDPKLTLRMEESILEYATEYSWQHQARRHFELASKLVETASPQPTDHMCNRELVSIEQYQVLAGS